MPGDDDRSVPSRTSADPPRSPSAKPNALPGASPSARPGTSPGASPSARPSEPGGSSTEAGAEGIPPELEEEARVGATPLAADVNAALVALSRAARSFLLYDPRNAAVRSFLDDLRRKTNAALVHGSMVLEVRPFELVIRASGEVVYLERDRERSLAFRMFRDGVRGLTVHPAVEWEEVLKLLEVLSIRYTGVRQQEDDIVTLLWKAGFQHIVVEAVEGFVPDEEMPEPGMDPARPGGAGAMELATKRHANRVAFPRDRDLPLPPPLPPIGEVSHRTMKPEDLASLREEDSSRGLGRDVVRVVTEMLAVIADPTDPTTLDDLLSFLSEARGFLLAEGQLRLLVELVRALRSAVVEDPAQMDVLLEGFADTAALGHILHSVPHGATSAPPELVDLLDELPADHLSHLIDLLSVQRGDGARMAARQLIARYAPRRSGYLLVRMRQSDPAVARDILKACAEVLPEEALEAALELSKVEDDGLAREVLNVLEKAPRKIEVSRALGGLLRSSVEEIRIETAGVLARRREQSGFDIILRRLEATGAQEPSNAEAAAYGRALVKLAPGHAEEAMAKWVHPTGGVLSRFMARTGRRPLLWAAVAGLEQIPGEATEALLREVMSRGDEELRRHAGSALARRRRAVEIAAERAAVSERAGTDGGGNLEVVDIPAATEATVEGEAVTTVEDVGALGPLPEEAPEAVEGTSDAAMEILRAYLASESDDG